MAGIESMRVRRARWERGDLRQPCVGRGCQSWIVSTVYTPVPLCEECRAAIVAAATAAVEGGGHE